LVAAASISVVQSIQLDVHLSYRNISAGGSFGAFLGTTPDRSLVLPDRAAHSNLVKIAALANRLCQVPFGIREICKDVYTIVGSAS